MPAIPAIIMAAGSIGSALISKKGSSSSSSAGTGANNAALNDLFSKLGTQSDKTFNWAGEDRASFKGALDPVSQWLQSILSNDRGSVLNAIGPEVRQTNQKYDAVSRAISEFAPRGGGRNAGMANLEFAKAGDISDLFTGARRNAAAGLQGVAGLYGNQSSTENATGLNALSTSLSGQLGVRGQDLQKLLADRAFGSGIGGSLSKLLQVVLGGLGKGGSVSSGFGTAAGLGGIPDPFANPYGEAGGN